jgi:hypothetical protein
MRGVQPQIARRCTNGFLGTLSLGNTKKGIDVLNPLRKTGYARLKLFHQRFDLLLRVGEQFLL